MSRLSDQEINSLITLFVAVCHDTPREEVIERLGTHPVNHAKFIKILSLYGPHYWRVYLDLTKGLYDV